MLAANTRLMFWVLLCENSDIAGKNTNPRKLKKDKFLKVEGRGVRTVGGAWGGWADSSGGAR